MEKKNIPQDPSPLDKFTKEVCYAVDEKGEYTTDLSRGWEVKATALDVAWKDIEERKQQALEKFKKGEVSPIVFFMEHKLMDLETLAAYTGFWQWQIKRHFKPKVFSGLSEKALKKYAEVFEVSVEDFKNMVVNEN
ncbi:MAG: hypothetical protein K2Q22_01140 [Cytophagales bacterium]|nr:hypothetical protein [Cytophagales bacterium]